ncbi:hypothetical protein [Spectribacter hydrogenoxidans]|uniref:Secreted protein n=1 Tax=Spectribacter hydrogenoxidans TaxID=3075608 RepID=A0ABU3C160_9GAMM|nr:hypothetical protein [Salinisphaera sp. W335]MDT0635255.1 hypothetical protein [Salinisphaera sp. W335]
MTVRQRFAGLLAVVAVLAASGVLAADPALGDKAAAALRSCRAQTGDNDRLACYDRAVDRHLSFDFAGHGRESTAVFTSPGPFRVRYRNEDVIFVIYIYRTSGKLVRSYGTGPGEGHLDVDTSGEFYIEVKATGTWKLWVTPLPARG